MLMQHVISINTWSFFEETDHWQKEALFTAYQSSILGTKDTENLFEIVRHSYLTMFWLIEDAVDTGPLDNDVMKAMYTVPQGMSARIAEAFAEKKFVSGETYCLFG